MIDAPPGYTSVVHQGLLHPPTLWKAPQRPAVFNLLILMMMSLWVSWRWCVVTLLVHVLMAVSWSYDPHFLVILWRHLLHRRYYGV